MSHCTAKSHSQVWLKLHATRRSWRRFWDNWSKWMRFWSGVLRERQGRYSKHMYVWREGLCVHVEESMICMWQVLLGSTMCQTQVINHDWSKTLPDTGSLNSLATLGDQITQFWPMRAKERWVSGFERNFASGGELLALVLSSSSCLESRHDMWSYRHEAITMRA